MFNIIEHKQKLDVCMAELVEDMGAECEVRYKEVRYAEGGAVG